MKYNASALVAKQTHIYITWRGKNEMSLIHGTGKQLSVVSNILLQT
jgi:hypothetical protein